MKTSYGKLAGKQHGSIYSTAVIVILFALFLTASLKIAPAYMDNSVIVNSMENMAEAEDLSELSVGDIRSKLMRTLNTNNISLDGDAMQLVKQGSKEYIDINYETRVKLFYNISAVVSFQNRFEKN